MKFFRLFTKNKYEKIKNRLLKDSKKKNGVELSKIIIVDLCKKDETICYKYKKIFFNIYKDIKTLDALEYAEDVLEFEHDAGFIKVMASRYRKIGNTLRAKELLLSISNRDYNIENLTLENFKNVIKECKDIKEIDKKINHLLADFPHEENKIYNYTYSILKDDKKTVAIKYGMKYFFNNPLDSKFRKNLIKRLDIEINLNEINCINTVILDLNYIKKLEQGSFLNSISFDKSKYEKELLIILNKVQEASLNIYIEKTLNKFPNEKEIIYKSSFILLKNDFENLSLKYMKKYEDISTSIVKKTIKDKIKNNSNIVINSKLLQGFTYKEKLFKNELNIFSISLNDVELENYINKVSKKFIKKSDSINKVSFSALKDSHTELAVEYGMKYFEEHQNEISFLKPLIKRLERLERHDDIYVVAKKAIEFSDDSDLVFIVFKHTIKNDILSFFNNNKEYILKNIDTFVDELNNKFSDNKFEVYRLIFQKISNIDYEKASYYGKKALGIKYNEYLIKDLYDLNIKYGHLSKAYEVIPFDVKLPTLKTKIKYIESFLDLYNNGFNLKIINEAKDFNPMKNKILYLLHNRLPYNSGGYATRSHGLLTNVSEFGWNINGVSRLGYPWDKMPEKKSMGKDIVDGISYHRLLKDNIGLGKLPLKEYLEEYAKEMLLFAKKEKPEIIHSASNYMNGLVGNYVAKSLGIKSVYEVRGLWEITRISRQPEWKDTEYYNLMVKMETQAAKEANIVLTLTEALKDEMIRRGVDAQKIIILPNGVTSKRFSPLIRNSILEEELKLKGKVVIGYIGSIVAYEGLEYLVSAAKILVDRNIRNVTFLIVGDGVTLEFIKNEVKKFELESYFIFTGRVPHEDVENYYSLVDIAPFPRKGQPVCEMVSPLKPFEAMAMEKAVISSNVNALQEIVQDGYNGLLFEKDNIEDLANKLELLIKNKDMRIGLGKTAREWTIQHRDWKVIAKTLSDSYLSLTKRS